MFANVTQLVAVAKLITKHKNNIMTLSIKEKAFDKISAKLMTLEIDIRKIKLDISLGNLGGLDEEQMNKVLFHLESEYAINLYLFSLIEKDS